MLSSENVHDPEIIIRNGPPWLLAIPLDSLRLAPRTFNALSGRGFSVVRDLENLSSEMLLVIPNFGRKSLHDLADRLRFAIRLGPASNRVVAENNDGSASSALAQTATKLGSQYANLDTLVSTILAAVSSLKPNVERVMRARMGIGVEPMTLQEIGDEMGVSRERVRQLEVKGASQMGRDPVWQDVLEAKLSRLLKHRNDSLLFLDLGILDDWFCGIEQMRAPFGYLLEHKSFLNQRFSLLNANGQWHVSHLTQREWDSVLEQARKLLSESGVSQGWSLSVARNQVDGLLDKKGCELRSELWLAAKRPAHFSSPQDGKESTLISYGQKLGALIDVVLSESEYPLHYSSIAHRIAERFDKQIDVRTVHNEAINVAFLYGRGTYGLLKHCPLSMEELALVREEAINIIFQGASDRQWSCTELLSILNERGMDFDGRLNHYIINIALHGAGELIELGRFMWMQSSTSMPEDVRRIDIHQAVITLLEQAGRPMSNTEIKEALQRERGLGKNFQIHPVGSLVRIGTGMWGLVERDSSLDMDEQSQLNDALLKILLERNSGIHISEILPALGNVVEAVSYIKDPALIFALARRNSRMRVSVGNYLYLSEWGEPRRMQKSEAVARALQHAGDKGLATNELLMSASALLRREISREGLYADISAAGARFDEEKRRWVILNTRDDPVLG